MSEEDKKPEICKAAHNPGIWPYYARCTENAGHEKDEPTHVDRHGTVWYGDEGGETED